MKEQGHELVGFTMQLWNQRRGLSVDEDGEPLPSRCCSLDDVYDARRVAEELGFPFYVLNLEREFERDVVEPFVQSYLEGETPIPCVACNSRLKFASLDRLALSLGCDKVATGHYARVGFDEEAGRHRLLRGRDARKDQSYFLWELTQEQLSRSLFPLGEMIEDEVREAARRARPLRRREARVAGDLLRARRRLRGLYRSLSRSRGKGRRATRARRDC